MNRAPQNREQRSQFPAPPISLFMEKLLVPLPEGVEQVKTKEIQREIKATIEDRFWHAWMRFEIAWHSYQAAHYGGILVRVGRTEPSWDRSSKAEVEAGIAFVEVMNEMMRVPAITRGHLAEKRSMLKRGKRVQPGGVTSELFKTAHTRWEEYLAEDVARLGA